MVSSVGWLMSSHNAPFIPVTTVLKGQKDGVCSDRMIFDKEQLESYERDGFIVVSGLLAEELTEKMSRAGHSIASRKQGVVPFFSVVERGLIFDGALAGVSSSELGLDFNAVDVFREAALWSKIPQAVAELMKLNPETQDVRILR
jgi:hypothetical protein